MSFSILVIGPIDRHDGLGTTLLAIGLSKARPPTPKLANAAGDQVITTSMNIS